MKMFYNFALWIIKKIDHIPIDLQIMIIENPMNLIDIPCFEKFPVSHHMLWNPHQAGYRLVERMKIEVSNSEYIKFIKRRSPCLVGTPALSNVYRERIVTLDFNDWIRALSSICCTGIKKQFLQVICLLFIER